MVVETSRCHQAELTGFERYSRTPRCCAAWVVSEYRRLLRMRRPIGRFCRPVVFEFVTPLRLSGSDSRDRTLHLDGLDPGRRHRVDLGLPVSSLPPNRNPSSLELYHHTVSRRRRIEHCPLETCVRGCQAFYLVPDLGNRSEMQISTESRGELRSDHPVRPATDRWRELLADAQHPAFDVGCGSTPPMMHGGRQHDICELRRRRADAIHRDNELCGIERPLGEVVAREVTERVGAEEHDCLHRTIG